VQNFVRGALAGKLKTAATAAFLGVCARYRQKPAICCADDTIGGGGAVVTATRRQLGMSRRRNAGSPALCAGPIRLNAN
jgi:hypothetical protein